MNLPKIEYCCYECNKSSISNFADWLFISLSHDGEIERTKCCNFFHHSKKYIEERFLKYWYFEFANQYSLYLAVKEPIKSYILTDVQNHMTKILHWSYDLYQMMYALYYTPFPTFIILTLSHNWIAFIKFNKAHNHSRGNRIINFLLCKLKDLWHYNYWCFRFFLVSYKLMFY